MDNEHPDVAEALLVTVADAGGSDLRSTRGPDSADPKAVRAALMAAVDAIPDAKLRRFQGGQVTVVM